VARLVAAVRGFYRYLHLHGHCSDNPSVDLQAPRAWKVLPKFLSIDQVDALIAQPDVSTPLGLRDRAMVELLYATGLRVSELVAVRMADLHLDEQYLTCVGKGSKERLVPIGAIAADWIRRYHREARPELAKRPQGKRTPGLFLNARRSAQSRGVLEGAETLRPRSRTAADA
jgi:integrase/recombinase XerD